MRQPLRGLLATAMIVALSLGFVSAFDFALFAGWVSYWLLCAIPMILVIAIAWRSQHPRWAARRSQPLKGLLLSFHLVPAAAVVGFIHLHTVGGGVGPPTPMLMMCVIVSVSITFLAAIIWGGWPFNRWFTHPVASGLVMLAACYLLNLLLFRLFYSFEFMKDASVYVERLDPKGLFNAWHALVFYVTALASMFLMLNFELWPLPRFPKLLAQPTLGVVWTLAALGLGTTFYGLGVQVMGMDPVVFMARVAVGFIFGSIVVLNMFQGSLFARASQPVRGVLNSLAALTIGSALTALYVKLAPIVTGALASGPPAYDLEIWIASALLSVTFPLLALHADFFEMWPLGSVATRSEAGGDERA